MNGILNVYFNSTIYTAICLNTFEDEELNKNGKRKRKKRYREEGVWGVGRTQWPLLAEVFAIPPLCGKKPFVLVFLYFIFFFIQMISYKRCILVQWKLSIYP